MQIDAKSTNLLQIHRSEDERVQILHALVDLRVTRHTAVQSNFKGPRKPHMIRAMSSFKVRHRPHSFNFQMAKTISH